MKVTEHTHLQTKLENAGWPHRQMSGTSQSCGIAAGVASLAREYLSEWADEGQARAVMALALLSVSTGPLFDSPEARLPEVWASTLRAALVGSAELDRATVTAASTVMLPEVGQANLGIRGVEFLQSKFEQ